MKSAKSETFSARPGCAPEAAAGTAIEGRPGRARRRDFLLVGAAPCRGRLHRSTVDYDGHPHYVISFKDKAKEPLSDVISSANATRLSDAEMLALIDNIPIGER